jgi:hypothetical protein
MTDRFKQQYNARTVRTITAAATAAITDRHIKCGGTTDYSLTLFGESALTIEAGFSLRVQATGTGIISIVPATNETINGTSGFTLFPGDDVIISYERPANNWKVVPRFQRIDATTTSGPKIANTNGTTAVNVFGAGGAPRAINITHVVSSALDATAGNIILKNGTDTVATIAKGTTDTVLVGQTSLANTAVAQGAVCTVESSTAGNSAVMIYYETVELTNPA